jgi:formamidopyrimidine-DNA glycosylase
MPELPEVESIRLQLEKFIIGHKINGLEIRWQNIFSGEKNKILGSRIIDARRFGKALVIDFENGFSLVIQIKMTGQLIYKGPNKHKAEGLSPKVLGGLGGKHTHIVFKLDRGGILYYNDVRKFGRIMVAESKKLKAESKFLAKLGQEFLKDMTLEKFSKILKNSGKPIKILLMEQDKMAGVGNIYANDALWLAAINPQLPANNLQQEQQRKLFKAIETVLKEGIKRGGASELAFVTPDGGEGHYQDFTLVYGREKEPCKKCKTQIRKVKLGGRGTYYCPKCQK